MQWCDLRVDNIALHAAQLRDPRLAPSPNRAQRRIDGAYTINARSMLYADVLPRGTRARLPPAQEHEVAIAGI